MNPVVAPANENQKGGILDGALVTEEVLESSKSLLDKNRAGGTKGAQQYYSPPELAAFVKRLIPGNVAVLDPTAGDGSLLRDFDPGYSFGIEIDADQINNAEGNYKAIRGDFQHVYTLLRRAGTEFDAIVANPPFDLKWSDPTIEDGKEMSSTKLAFIAATRLLTHNAQLIFICGRDRFDREIAELPEAEGVYALVEVEDLFDGVGLPCVIACAVPSDLRHYRHKQNPPARQKISREALGLAASWAQEQRNEAFGGYSRVASYSSNTHKLAEIWPAIQKEYDRRVEKRLGKYKRQFDVASEGSTLQVILSPFAKIVLGKTGQLRTIELLHNHNLNYFRQNEAAWRHVTEAAEDEYITIDPKLVEKIDSLLADNRKIAAPMYPLKEIQRLGFLDTIDRIKCVKTDEEKGFYAGDRYQIQTRPNAYEVQNRRFEANKKTGEWQEKLFVERRKRLQVRIWNFQSRAHSFYDDDEHQQDIQYLADHFAIPEAPDIGTRFPADTHAMRVLLSEIEWDTLIPNSARAAAADDPEVLAAIERGELEIVDLEDGGRTIRGIRLRKFQREDLARMLVKGSGLLAWEQGLGKTLAGLMYIEACRRLGAQDAALVVVPQDLIPQWQRESVRFFGREMELIAARDIQIDNPEKGKNKRKKIKHTIPVHAVAKNVANHTRKGGSGWYITYYEAISTIGTRGKNDELPPVIVEEKEIPGKWHPPRYEYTADGYQYVEGIQDPPKIKKIMSWELCPHCKADRRSGWSGTFCSAEIEDPKLGKVGSICGYAHVKAKVKPAGSILSTAFRRGIVIVDEVTMIGGSASGEESIRSKVVRGIRARHKLGMTGTPIKNYISQAFWLLRWTVDEKRFPYSWVGGKTKFEDDFCVVEWNVSKGVKQNRKAKPDVTNLSMLWKLLSSCVIRRRKEETGEPLVPKRYHEHLVPLGVAQRTQMQKWMKDFHLLFKEKYPDSKVVKANMHEALAPMLGMRPKLEYACTLPLGDPDYEWTGIEVSNWTPANLRTLELAMALAKEGRKVLVGSATKETGRWLAEQLVEKGVNAVHILDADGTTYVPKRRAAVVHAFQTDTVQVFCAGIQAIRFGHNLDKGSAVIVHGPPWDWESFDQFISRIHRLTSERDVDVHVVLPHGTNQTLSERKWELLQQKGQSAELALDGRLLEKDTEQINPDAVMQELVEKGLTASDNEIEEEEVEAAWERMPDFENYVAPKGLAQGRTVKERPSDWTIFSTVFADLFKPQPLGLPVKASASNYDELVAVISSDDHSERVLSYHDRADLTPEPTPEEETEDTKFSDSPLDPIYTPFAGVESPASESDDALIPGEENGASSSESEGEELGAHAPGTEPASPSSTNGHKRDPQAVVAAIKELGELHKQGILEPQEFADAKKALLAELGAKVAA